ncbi:MAG TPA: hypothetical protein DCK99_19440 [Blastocatellia bacterium]|jgi:Flp pilus assembly protein TadD|nr:hypothetical protein [Blastocatellia bacterium]
MLRIMKRINFSSLALLFLLAIAAVVSALPAVAMPSVQTKSSSHRQTKRQPSQTKMSSDNGRDCHECADWYRACIKEHEATDDGYGSAGRNAATCQSDDAFTGCLAGCAQLRKRLSVRKHKH